jgi:hypothetical protein
VFATAQACAGQRSLGAASQRAARDGEPERQVSLANELQPPESCSQWRVEGAGGSRLGSEKLVALLGRGKGDASSSCCSSPQDQQRRWPRVTPQRLRLRVRTMLTDGGGGGTSFEEDLDSVAPRSAPAGASEPPPPGGVGLGIRTVRLFGEAGPAPGIGGGGSGAGGGDTALDFKLAAAVLRTGGGGGASGSDEDEVSEVRLQDPRLPHSVRGESSLGQHRAGAILQLPGRSRSLTALASLAGTGSRAGLASARLVSSVGARRPTIGSPLVSELRAGTRTRQPLPPTPLWSRGRAGSCRSPCPWY